MALSAESMSRLEGPPRSPAGHVTERRLGSIRRTSSISTVWPQGAGHPMLMTGEARDLMTPERGNPRTVAAGTFEILVSPSREILRITSVPDYPSLQKLIGQRAGANLRAHLANTLSEEKRSGTPLYLLLDDYSGASLVASWALARWRALPEQRSEQATIMRRKRMQGVCFGFAPGSSALEPETILARSTRPAASVPEIARPEDPVGWHKMIGQEGAAMRRLRCIDVWLDPTTVHVKVHFQDSSTSPEGGRVALHEYLVAATAHRANLELLTLESDPRVLPFRECPGAVPLAQRMLGRPLTAFRESVIEKLPGTLGCTHLNDVLRSLADVSPLIDALIASSES